MKLAEDIKQTFEEQEPALLAFEHGNPEQYLASWSHTEDVTIFGGWGAYEKGWEEVGPRMEWASSRFHGAHLTCEILSIGQSGDLAYAIYLEKGEVRLSEDDKYQPMVLRVTIIYRRE